MTTTPAKLSANRRNAKLSTGPRSSAGKFLAKRNSISHGLRSFDILIPGEFPEEWTEFRDGIVGSFAPAGALESELAERAARLFWRLRRVGKYESGSILQTQENIVKPLWDATPLDENDSFAEPPEAEPGKTRTPGDVRPELAAAVSKAGTLGRALAWLEALAKPTWDDELTGTEVMPFLQLMYEILPEADPDDSDLDDLDDDFHDPDSDETDDDGETEYWPGPADERFTAELGLSEDDRDAPEEWSGWTGEVVRQAVAKLAAFPEWPAGKLQSMARRSFRRKRKSLLTKIAQLEAELSRGIIIAEHAEAAIQGRVAIPVGPAVEIVMRYESHLQRQLVQTLHELERLQSRRAGDVVIPPMVLDVTVHPASE